VSFWAVIPARRASTRLPDKPLADIHGKPMVVRVAERAAASGAHRVIVATDDSEIAAVVSHHQFEVLITRPDHPSGTDRIAEVMQQLNAKPDQIVINVQGDEPLIEPELIASVAQTLRDSPLASVATAAAPITDSAALTSPHVVKVVCNAQSEAIYFSRAPIPFARDNWPNLAAVALSTPGYRRHIGIYGFRAQALAAFVGSAPCELERTEQLEQLRWLWMGHRIVVHQALAPPAPGVDTPEDLEQVRLLWAARGYL
jgi:3-deoxy-manno-octulosonate cytidylyltransferase (CMP-KDO synthetase)